MESLWIQTALPYQTFPVLENSMHCDVVIVGGGLNGLATAYYLAKEGKKVVVIEKDVMLHGATGNSTGKLTTQHGLIYTELIRKFGVEAAAQYYQANEEAITVAASLAKPADITKTQSVLFAQTDSGVQRLQDEMKAYEALHIDGSNRLNSELPLNIKSTLTLQNQYQIHPVRFGQTLAQLAVEAGATIYEYTRIKSILLKEQQVHLVNGTTIDFQEIILSTHYPIESITSGQILKLLVNRAYLVAATTDMPLMNQYLGVDDVQQTMRTATVDGQAYFIFGGVSHPAGFESHTRRYYQQLYDTLKTDYMLSNFVTGWSAQDPETPDIIPYAGRLTNDLPHVYFSTGNRKWGLSTALVSAKVNTDLIVGRHNPAIALYSPNRTKFGDLFLQGVKTTGRVAKEFTIGHIGRMDAPICTHMGCRTRWNEAEETWDCPCHGSRFRKDGSVLEGPATKPLDL